MSDFVKLEFWTNDGRTMIAPVLIVPVGYAIPRIGEMVALPGDLNHKWRRCEGVIHGFDLVQEAEIEGVPCRLFTIRVLLDRD